MKKTIDSLLLLTLWLFAGAASARAETPVVWNCRIAADRPIEVKAYHGETLRFLPDFIGTNGESLSGFDLSLCWQTNGMSNVWWTCSGTTFAPTQDVGAASYRFFVRAESGTGIVYRANGILYMLPSPGFVPNKIALPVSTIDFAAVQAVHAPWLLPESVSNKLDRATGLPDIAAGDTLDAYFLQVRKLTNHAKKGTIE